MSNLQAPGAAGTLQPDQFARLLLSSWTRDANSFKASPEQADLTLAYALKDVCLVDGWNDQPQRCIIAANTLRLLLERRPHPEIAALASWCDGVAAMVESRNELAIKYFDQANREFHALNKRLLAAETQIIKLYALALLGKHKQAIECGLQARHIFIQHNDQLGAARVENNIGNVYFRIGRYHEAKRFQSCARERFIELDDPIRIARINNCLANTLALLHEFSAAEDLYEQALAAAVKANLSSTQAEIESNIGNMALYQARYERALDFLERARRKYVALNMPHQSAVSELEIADAYLELNLLPEAAEIYSRVTRSFASLGMRAEEAHATAQLARTAALTGDHLEARALLSRAEELYELEGNEIGSAAVLLSKAQLHFFTRHFELAKTCAEKAEGCFAGAGNWHRQLLARWLRAESTLELGELDNAASILRSTIRDAQLQIQPQVEQLAHTSLGLIATRRDNHNLAEVEFNAAIELVETLRSPLPAEEFRTAFFGKKLRAYDELLRVLLRDTSRADEAFDVLERARSRALADALATESQSRMPSDEFEVALLRRQKDLRGELNWFYTHMNREAGVSSGAVAETFAAAQERERELLTVTRQLQHCGFANLQSATPIKIGELQRNLGQDTAIVEYAVLDDECLAFVVTDSNVEVLRHVASIANIRELINDFRFQLRTFRHGPEVIDDYIEQLTARTQRSLRELNDLILRPIEQNIGNRRLIVIPDDVLHYLPFSALYDGRSYAVERREILYAPSAKVLQHCLAQPESKLRQPLLVAVADSKTPHVCAEIDSIARLFPRNVTLVGDEATDEVFRSKLPETDFIHIASHGQFRSDNPMFSSLELATGRLNVLDTYELDLTGKLITLSACETGVNAISPGDEILGLARGFFSAGAASLMLSHWAVNDKATAELMSHFYSSLKVGDTPAKALRLAQINLLQRKLHPYYWAAFVLLGRW